MDEKQPTTGSLLTLRQFRPTRPRQQQAYQHHLERLAKKEYPEGSTERKLSDFYKMAMDSVRRNKEGVKPVMPLINEIEKAKNTSDLRKIQLKYATFGYGVPMGIGFGADEKMPQ